MGIEKKLKTYLIYTYWCSMNYADTERICAVLDLCWLQEVWDENQADIIIFNTCTIKKKAEDKVFWVFTQLSKIKKKSPYKKIWITGCMVKKTWIRDKESDLCSNDPLFLRSKYIDFVFRILDTPKLPELLWFKKDNFSENYFNEDKDNFFNLNQKFSSNFQVIIPIQTWCDNFCSYCVVPYTRWREFSRSIEDILREVKIWVKKWAKEILLVWQNVNSFWKWTPNTKRKWDNENSKWFEWNEKTPFTFLLEEVCNVDFVERVRFQSSNPHDMSDDIIEIITKNPKIMPNLHLALQSWNDEILKKMNRRHTVDDYKKIVNKIRNNDPSFWITTDIIVWFPWETESQFEDTLKIIEDIKFDMIYISQYSPRKWTYSGDKLKDDVDEEEKNKRWHEVNNLLIKILETRLQSFIWKIVKVFVENIVDWIAEWKTEHNFICRFKIWEIKVWDIVDVKITWKTKWALEGEII